ncbi:MAG TPA: hypothetical protein DHW73_04110 [Pseudomonas sp.]|nr:hypothetical protein [Pseudomonadales bacterium]HCB41681.1 hypothetical protein [Pseudomonas sp.]HCL40541.1 hypothetical protein [Pseudomonas sp.]|tara:strand:+ start:10717 stop:11454 length:738 start_codon:yes stop_codon:yes gene_type:complete
MSLFSFQGKIWLAERSAVGMPLAFTWLGNAPQLQLQINTTNTDKTDSFSGNRLQIGRLAGAKTVNINITLDEWTLHNIAMAFYAQQVAVTGDDVTGEELPMPLAPGDVIRLNERFISSLVLDNGGTPLVLDTDYRIESAPAGLVEMLTAQASQIEADYSYGSAVSMALFSEQPKERWLMFDGINTENGERSVFELYRTIFNPPGDLNMITDEYGNLPLTGAALVDVAKLADDVLGGFGRFVEAAA